MATYARPCMLFKERCPKTKEKYDKLKTNKSIWLFMFLIQIRNSGPLTNEIERFVYLLADIQTEKFQASKQQ